MADGIPFQEAIDFFRQKVRLPTARWDDLWQGAHARGFAVAGAMRDDMLADFQSAIGKALESGTSLEEFRADFDQIVERYGWSYNGGRGWRTKVIYQTNLNTAYQAGRFAQMTDPDVVKYRPYWRYRHGDSKVPRPEHQAWDGLILAWDDPWWKDHYPPNGWGCSCYVEAITAREAGKEGTDEAPDDGTYAYRDPISGDRHQVPEGIDPGWAYNVGDAWLNGVVPRQMQTPLPPLVGPRPAATLPSMPAPRPADAKRLLPSGLADKEYVEHFLLEFGAAPGRGVPFRDATGTRLIISDELFRRPSGRLKVTKFGRETDLLLLADAIKDPDEIWVDWADAGRGPVLRRRYLRLITLPGQDKPLLAVFEATKSGWYGTTAFAPERPGYLERQRSGALLFRRKG